MTNEEHQKLQSFINSVHEYMIDWLEQEAKPVTEELCREALEAYIEVTK